MNTLATRRSNRANLANLGLLGPAGEALHKKDAHEIARGEDWKHLGPGNFFVSRDPWVRPVSLQTDPDGAMWVMDWYDREYYQKSPDADPTGPASGDKRVIRGGSWADLPSALRVTSRMSAEPDYEDRTIGFRCAMDTGH